MKLFLPKVSVISLALLLTAGVIIVADSGCAPKAACGNKRDHRRRKRRVHKFAPTMAMIRLTKAEQSDFI
ncbi:MAG: hypothetical protein ACJ77K_11955 [Bacteroidia bacterium]